MYVLSVYCNTLTHWSALPISAIRAVYVLSVSCNTLTHWPALPISAIRVVYVLSVYCNTLTHWPALPISAIRAVCVLPNQGTWSNSFELFPLSIRFRRSLLLRSPIISANYCTAHYTTTSVRLWPFLSNRTISTVVPLSCVFNFSFPQISANLKSVCRLLPLLWLCFIIKQSPHLNENIPKIHKITTFMLTTIISLISSFYQYFNWERIKQGAFKSCTVNFTVILLD